MEIRQRWGTRVAELYEELRPLLFSIAYRMVGSVGEAEDIVQEAFLRFHRAAAEGAAIESPKAWLSTVVTRLAIDHLRSARV
ncbi:MAG TPA: sigma-70 family RNA polymerase sigma factor, partial [Actinomycetota bacterium]|nr:sigma-70 family RNA polymerase sigma factor [Actinomycetota bacterium]